MRVGEKFVTNQGSWLEVIEYHGSERVKVKFLDMFQHEKVVQAAHIYRGKVKNPYHPSVFGVGYNGIGGFSPSKDGKVTKEYRAWVGVLERCFSENLKDVRPTYRNCSVETQWYNFQTFASWFVQQTGYSEEGWHLDKDLLLIGNKHYSPEFCVLLPIQINCFISTFSKPNKKERIGVHWCSTIKKYIACCGDGSGIRKSIGRFDLEEDAYSAYRAFKSRVARGLAEQWGDRLDPKAYNALLNYKQWEDT